jgi:hypothetical protein
MAKIENLTILNPADKTHLYAVAIGKGAPTDATNRLVTDTHVFKVGSQYTDLTTKKLYIRVDTKKIVADWVEIGGAGS